MDGVSRARALWLAVAIVACGVGLRVLPHVGRVIAPATPSATGGERLRDRPAWRLALGLGVEALLVGGCLLVLLRTIRRPGAPTVALLGAFAVGHLAGSETRTFPFVPWRMYSGPTDDVRAIELVGVTAAGEPKVLDPRELFPSLGHRDMALHVATQVEAIARGADAGAHRATLRAIAAAHERRHGGETLRRIDVVAVEWRAAPPSRRRLWSVEVGP